ncbi:fruiting body protein Sc7 [Rhizoctonia solani AG-3 Rhs1AP]|uniref:Fruiting body protein Sc7 n=2 Tax=Rhizoctonia solani AG-3 TaxID=1086053 RepID=A0A074SL79_9AGAM|nr:fruiting body protein Sc7 [Rhizoctonia solani AG-3 Rhs1AP]KEP50767.1 fruiting body protein Sc7 [Rhizoctonia solani 123E]
MVSFTAALFALIALASSVSAHWQGNTLNSTEIHKIGSHLSFNATQLAIRDLSARTIWPHQDYIDAHNNERAKHGAAALAWDDGLSASAQAWSNQCKFERSRAGQNLAAGTGGPTPAIAVGWWNAEAVEYDPKNPQASHWTQVVWKSSTRFGCAVTQCAAGTIFPADYIAYYFVCHYSPYGNVIGQFE